MLLAQFEAIFLISCVSSIGYVDPVITESSLRIHKKVLLPDFLCHKTVPKTTEY